MKRLFIFIFSTFVCTMAGAQGPGVFDGISNTSNYYEKVLVIPSDAFPNGANNLAVDIILGNITFWGNIEIEVTGGWYYQNTVGKLTKIFAVGMGPNNNIYANESRVSETMGFVPYNIAIGELEWNASNTRYQIPLYHLVATMNDYTIKVRLLGHVATADNVKASLNISSSYNRTAITKNIVHYNGQIGIGATAPAAMLDVLGSNSSAKVSGNSVYYGGGRKSLSVIYGDPYGNGAAYDPSNPSTYGGRAGGYLKGGDGGWYGGGGAGVVAIGGNGSTISDGSATGGAGIFAKGGLNGDGSRTYAAWFDSGNVNIKTGNLWVGTNTQPDKLVLGFNAGETRRSFAVIDESGGQVVMVPTGNGVVNGSYASFGYNFYASSPSQLNYRGGYNYAAGVSVGRSINFWTAAPGMSGNLLSPLLAMTVTNEGKVGVGTSSPNEKFSVNGNISAKKLIITQTGWSDYVFHPDYKLKPLDQVEAFIKKNNHLPDIPSAKEVESKGISVGENQALLLKKIEELTLYLIELKKENEQIRVSNGRQQQQINRLLAAGRAGKK